MLAIYPEQMEVAISEAPLCQYNMQVIDIGTGHAEYGTGQNSQSALMAEFSYLVRSILAIPCQLAFSSGSVATRSCSWSV